MDIARHLIKQQQQSQCAMRRIGPGIQVARARGGQQLVAQGTARGIKIGNDLEPDGAADMRPVREPEIQDIARAGYAAGPASASARTRTECTARRPDRSKIWCRQDVPSATMMSSAAALRTAGNRLASAMARDSAWVFA